MITCISSTVSILLNLWWHCQFTLCIFWHTVKANNSDCGWVLFKFARNISEGNIWVKVKLINTKGCQRVSMPFTVKQSFLATVYTCSIKWVKKILCFVCQNILIVRCQMSKIIIVTFFYGIFYCLEESRWFIVIHQKLPL